MPTQTRRCSYRTSRVWQTMSEKHRYVHTCVYECVGMALCVVWVEGGRGGGGEGGYVLIHTSLWCEYGQFM